LPASAGFLLSLQKLCHNQQNNHAGVLPVNQASDYSGQTAQFKVGECTYEINVLSVQAAFKLQFVLGNQLKGLSGSGIGQIDPDTMWNLAVKLLKHAEVDGFPLDMEKHFAARIDELDLVVVEAIKANCPGFFKKLGGLKGLFLAALEKQLGSAKSPSESATSDPATATS
jgi:hypothetical protein